MSGVVTGNRHLKYAGTRPAIKKDGIAGRDADFDRVVVVACEPETQVRRVMQRDGVSEADARARLAAQLPIETKIAAADFVIRTDGSKDETNRRTEAVYRELMGR